MNPLRIVTSLPPDRADAPERVPDLVLIHGWGLGRAAWDDVLPLLTARFRVHRASLPGYDDSIDALDVASCRGGKEDDAEQTFDACAAALAQALPADCTVCGWSLGALFALRAAQLAPRHFARLIVCGATPCFTQRDDWPHAQAPAVLDGFAAALGQDGAATRQRFVALFNQGDRRARQITRAFAHALADETAAPAPDVAALARGLDWLRRVDLRASLAAHAGPGSIPPCLVVHGARDPLMPLPAAHWLAQALPDARLEVFADAAHAPFASDAPRFAQLLIDFCHA